jgi:hypothetical protein
MSSLKVEDIRRNDAHGAPYEGRKQRLPDRWLMHWIFPHPQIPPSEYLEGELGCFFHQNKSPNLYPTYPLESLNGRSTGR